jgi:hypothetical protein
MAPLEVKALLETFVNLEAEEALVAVRKLREHVRGLKLAPGQPGAYKALEIAVVEAREAQASLEQVQKYLRLAANEIFVREGASSVT